MMLWNALAAAPDRAPKARMMAGVITASTTAYSVIVWPSERRMRLRKSGMLVWSSRAPRSAIPGRGGSARPSVAEQAHFFATLAREEVDAVDEPHPVAAG